ncbi:TolC family protein [Flavitalea sp. BT771]|uniref:TolC family protein n=1 Tax=Flavitalea sp. BT771 TaxID=3063329 RepID=UPI0026E42C61|nr:TolC family protein [Flavitalea sp. BT771]MDO6435507.1 TolC family protein [Flavitalea sp. BT771]MDV6224407.1 TolC family protein [Flavitalea sp. BT771]
MVPKLISLCFGLLLALGVTAQDKVLEGYIRYGLDSNLVLRQQGYDLQKALIDLKRAQSLFYPQAGFSSQYTLAHGGRSQDIPVGDLLNGVYSTLNQLTASNKFPQVGNQTIQFLPNDYHDTKVEVTLPLINTDLRHNREVSGEMINARRADLDVYRRELVQQIRQGYYQYLQAGKAVEIYTNALGLVKENRRVSEKFVENRMATKEIVLRAQAQVSQVESSLIEAKNKIRNARAYFNFLLNRPLDADVQTDEALFSLKTDTTGAIARGGLPPTVADAAVLRLSPGVPAGREELAKLGSMQRILASNLRYTRNYLVPKLNAFYDVGFQGFGFRFNSDQFYQMAGLQLVWPLFKANDNKYKVRQSEIDVRAVGDQYRQLTQQLTLQVQTSANDYSSAVEALQSLMDEVASTRETYRLAERRFKEGNAIQIELIDARTQMTSAELRYSLACLTVLNRAAELERVTAAYKF